VTASPKLSGAVRIAQALPALAALNLHGLTQGRYLMAVPAALALIAGLARGWAPVFTENRVIVVAAAGALVGVGLGFAIPVPVGPMPELLQSALCGVLVPLSVYAALAGRRVYAWLFCWLLAILSMRADATPLATVSLVALCLATLFAAALAQGERLQLGRAALLGFAVLLPTIVAGTWAVERGVDASQGTLINLVGGTLDALGTRLKAEFELPKQLYLGSSGTVPDSKRALFELDGAIPSHLRGVVLDRFDGRQWTTSPELEQQVLDLGSLTAPSKTRETTALFYASLGERLPSPAGVRRVAGTTVKVRGGWVLGAADLRGLTVTFKADEARQLPPESSPGVMLIALPPELKGSLRPIAERIVKDAATPRAKAEAIERYLQDNFTYSLRADLTGREHPLVVMLKERRPAYCSYFASAMAALLRALDVPARLVGGFVSEEPNPITKKSVIRARDAHAWVEVWLEEEGRYVAFDPTPAASRDQALGVQRGVGNAIWEAIGAAFSAFFAAFRRAPGEVMQRLLLSPYLWGLIAALILWRAVARTRLARRVKQRAALEGADLALREVYASYLRLLRRRAQIAPAPTDTDDAILERIGRARGAAAKDAAARFVQSYREARYRRAPWRPESFASSLEDLARALAQA
jgi:transglutaminase-like putative cysteine protease